VIDTPQPEMEASSGWGDTLVAMVGCQIQRLNFPAAWHPNPRKRLRSRPRPFNRIAQAGADFTGRRQHFL
jgi:hypothetical protein